MWFVKSKKALASSIVAVIGILFVFGLFSLIALAGWGYVNNSFQSMDNDTVSPSVKDQIDGLTSYVNWGDRIFTLFFIALLIGFMVTSFTASTDNAVYIALYLFFLVLVSVVAMFLSNGWHYLINQPNLIAAASELAFTNWFMSYLPVITFFMGLIGGIIFYARKKNSPSSRGFNVDFDGGGSL